MPRLSSSLSPSSPRFADTMPLRAGSIADTPLRAGSIADTPLLEAKLPSMAGVTLALPRAPPRGKITLPEPTILIINTDPIPREPAPPVYGADGVPVKISVGDLDDFPALVAVIYALPKGSIVVVVLSDGREIDWGQLSTLAASRGVAFHVVDASIEKNHAAVVAMIEDADLPSLWVHNQAPMPGANSALIGALLKAGEARKIWCSGQGVTAKDYNLSAADPRSAVVRDGDLYFPTINKSFSYNGISTTGFTLQFNDPSCKRLMDLFPGLPAASIALKPLMGFLVPTHTPVLVWILYFGGKGNNFRKLCTECFGEVPDSYKRIINLLGFSSGDCFQVVKEAKRHNPALAAIFSDLVDMAPVLTPTAGNQPILDGVSTPIDDRIMCVVGLICLAIKLRGMEDCFQGPKQPVLNDAWKSSKEPDPDTPTGELHDLAAMIWAVAQQLGISLEIPETIPVGGMPMPGPMRALLEQIMQVE